MDALCGSLTPARGRLPRDWPRLTLSEPSIDERLDAALALVAALDLTNASAATPIGVGCRVCDRLDCSQRAVPPQGRPLLIDRNSSTFVPYPVESEETAV
ncbi:short-chain fatty acyl-CoA regulator family protein [Streptomyces bauhiniae]|uniref:short-chain fatty acyl-CoA regulator family protein n=1 Tax=Streptomyces bauhiniae TaxID=2340725 RepID=UPI003451ED45